LVAAWEKQLELCMSKSLDQITRRLLVIWLCISAITFHTVPLMAADASQGKAIAKRWCASCHLVEKDQTTAADHAPPFAYIARIPDFDENKLAFLLLVPHPNMPNLSLNRSEVADLADYIAAVK
jgi:mono/diheme cytochrome c family protein